MSVASVRPPFVGREVEWDALAEALELRAERPGLLVGGEAGIGKTGLLDEFAADAARRGVTVTRGGCLPLGAGALPFAPFVEVLGRLRETLGADDAVFGGAERRALATLLPELGPRRPKRRSSKRGLWRQMNRPNRASAAGTQPRLRLRP